MIYTIEIRKDIEADSDDDAKVKGNKIATEQGGYLTAVFDEHWEEI